MRLLMPLKNFEKMTTYRSNGKLLLTAEYVVLDGAKALALPTKLGQSLTIEPLMESKLYWKSIDYSGNIWFENELSVNSLISSFNHTEESISKRLFEILVSAKQLNPIFLNNGGYKISTCLDFPKNWGLGSSSTLINNIATWANIDAYELLKLTFGGSGYDIACAQHNNPIIYRKNKLDDSKTIKSISFNPVFKENLFFIYLNRKQDSRDGIKHYNANKNNLAPIITEINTITDQIICTKTLSEFEALVTKHESIISSIINLPPVKSTLFYDYSGTIKSLGAWGGDFIMATGSLADMDYFIKKGYTSIVPYDKMIL